MRITIDELRNLGACKGGLAEFRLMFGKSALVTRGNLMAMRRHVIWLVDSHPRIKPYRDRYGKRAKAHLNRYYDAKAPLESKYYQEKTIGATEFNAGVERCRDALDKSCANSLANVMGLPREPKMARTKRGPKR